MGNYMDSDDLSFSLAYLSSDDLTSTQKTEAITRAEGHFDMVVGRYRTTPLSNISQGAKNIVIDLAVYFCLRLVFGEKAHQAEEYVKQFGNPSKKLEEYCEKGYKLDEDDAAGRDKRVKSSTEDYESTFTHGDETKWGVDPERIKDEDDERE